MAANYWTRWPHIIGTGGRIHQNMHHSPRFSRCGGFDAYVTASDAPHSVKELTVQCGWVDATVLINRESGTGKKMFAKSMYTVSLRAHGPFVAVNCVAFPENLLESELFCYDDGAFTGGLDVLSIHVPVLRHRSADILPLAHHRKRRQKIEVEYFPKDDWEQTLDLLRKPTKGRIASGFERDSSRVAVSPCTTRKVEELVLCYPWMN